MTAVEARPATPDRRDALAVYVHFPWCVQRCPYCDFATEAIVPAHIPHEAYASAVVRELSLRAPTVEGLRARTLFFGGGTPGLWAARELGRVISAVRERLGEPDEVTVECNPTALDGDAALALRDAGATRLSVGVQSLRDPHLRYLGRAHDAGEALAAVRAAGRVGGLRVSADLMFGMPEQRASELLEDARALLDAGAAHVSAYALTIEPATRFGELARKNRLPRMPDEGVAELFAALHDSMSREGLAQYEVSNYARPGEEARHNVAYWRGVPYLGLGAGAVGCVPGGAHEALRYRDGADTKGYLAALGEGALPPADEERLDAETLVREGLMLGMRTAEGVDLDALKTRTGLDARLGRERELRRAVSRGDVLDQGDRWVIPRERWLFVDDIIARLF